MSRSLQTAVVLAVGSELTTGSTRDTNSGQLAFDLSAMGVEVLWTSCLPDRLERVRVAFAAALHEADLIVSTGGLGPTPDDLTREAIAAATELELTVDPELERWLRALFRRRRVTMPESNLKQAWLVPGATGLRNGNGTAPGWWLDLPDGRLVVALPGPPREMRPMWNAHVLPRLVERGAGGAVASETLRLTGIGESALVELIGEEVLRNPVPEVATYARADAVDVRITAHGEGAAGRVQETVDVLLERIGEYVFARGDEGWPQVIERLLGGRLLQLAEIGTGGQLVALLGEMPALRHAEYWGAQLAGDLAAWASGAAAPSHVAIAVRATPREVDTRVEVAIADGAGVKLEERTAFLGGAEGQRRAALAACAELWRFLSSRPA